MLNTTHTLVGLALARGGLDRQARHAAVTAVIAANLPDIDIITQLQSTATYIDLHRGFTHTLLGIPLLALALAAVMDRITGGNFRGHFIVALVALSTHPLLDFANTYGVRPFSPFLDRWYYGDTVAIIDPYLDLILLGALLASWLIPQYRRFAIAIGGVVIFTYVAALISYRDMAREHLAAWIETVPGYQHSAVFPTTLEPTGWTGMVDTENAVFAVRVDSHDGVGEELFRLEKHPRSQIVQAAEQSHTGSVFMGFARFPVAQVEGTRSGYKVFFMDARFHRENAIFGAEITLDTALQVIGETMSFNVPLGSEVVFEGDQPEEIVLGDHSQ